MKRKFGPREVVRFHFHNFMSRGTSAQLIGLAVITAALVLVFATLVYLFQLDPTDDTTVGYSLWTSMTRMLRSSPPAWDPAQPVYMFVMVAILVVGMLLVATLIGIFTSGFRSLMLRMRAGRSPVPVNNHILILGWSPTLIGIANELVVAHEHLQRVTNIVILADKDKVEMDEELRSGVSQTGKTRIITRRGDPFSYQDLELVNIDAARTIIVIPPKRAPGRRQRDANPDMEVIKTLMAIVNNPLRENKHYNIVTAIHDEQNVAVARLAAGDEVELIPSVDVISRITAQTCRQSGLPMVYTEIMSFHGTEIYFVSEDRLTGKSFRDAAFAYSASCVLGVFTKNRETLLNPAADRPIDRDDRLLVLSLDDSTIDYDPRDLAVDKTAINVREPKLPQPERNLILGWNNGAPTILEQLERYVAPGSELLVVVPRPSQIEHVEKYGRKMTNHSFSVRAADVTGEGAFDDIDVAGFNHVILLSYDELDPVKSDSRVLVTLLRVRGMIDDAKQKVAVVSEMVMQRNSQVAQSAREDDFVVGDHLVGLLYSQVAENRELNSVFDTLLSEGGSEIYLKPADAYVGLGKPVSFYTVIEAAFGRAELAFGYRRKDQLVTLNPRKTDTITFEKGDSIVVLAEN